MHEQKIRKQKAEEFWLDDVDEILKFNGSMTVMGVVEDETDIENIEFSLYSASNLFCLLFIYFEPWLTPNENIICVSECVCMNEMGNGKILHAIVMDVSMW